MRGRVIRYAVAWGEGTENAEIMQFISNLAT
jgi:hypothetical protein